MPIAEEARFPPLAREAMTPEQKAVADTIASGPRKSGAGPFDAWLRSPALADRLQKVGEYVRFQSSLPPRLSELAILIAGRHWGAAFEWASHYPLAREAGVPESVLADLGAGKVPAGMSDDEALVFDVATELRRDGTLCDATHARALTRLGERGIVDLIAIAGYYAIVCLTLNVARVPPPPDSKAPPLPPLAQAR